MNTSPPARSLQDMVNRNLSVATLGLLLGLASCTGEIGRDLGKENEARWRTPGDLSSSSNELPGAKPGVNLLVGTSVIHRLTRAEYANTVRDLLNASLGSLDSLPPDTGGDGFSRTSVSQGSSANTLQAYEAASSELVETVFKDANLKTQLVTCDLSTGTACIKSTLQTFLPKAWRRPVEAAEVDRLMALADTEAKAGGSTEEQLKLALRAALTSAKFLYLIEKDPNPADTQPHKLTDYELASRLSYFLWSSMPDPELTSASVQGKLQDDAALTQQVSRMLADRKGVAMTNVFAAEWVQLQTIAAKQPDPTMFPMVNDALKQSMMQQTTTFFQDLLTNGGPISNLVASDYTFVDAGLANLYGLPAPKGPGFVKTSVAGTTRVGGMLGQSTILMQFANQVRPSAVKRGAWVLDNVLCAPSPPPPPDVAAANMANDMDPAFLARVAMQTAREHLAEHRAPAKCAVCHNRIDPIGLGLENYDAVGQYRTMDVGKTIDASGQLDPGDPNTKFADARGLTELLAKDNRVASCVGQKLLTFALTRTPTETEIEYIGALASGNSDTLASMITNVVTGTPFRVRSGAGL
jgi:hypothetical protein